MKTFTVEVQIKIDEECSSSAADMVHYHLRKIKEFTNVEIFCEPYVETDFE